MDGFLTAQAGLFDAKYLAFLETIAHLRPKLHRYCSRMVGSVLDGEDVVQDALFQANRKLETFDDTKPLAPWLFRIAHNQCIDFLRRRRVRRTAEAEAAVPDSVVPTDPQGQPIERALERLVLTLPPKERACVLLKDVFDYLSRGLSAELASEGVRSVVLRTTGLPETTTIDVVFDLHAKSMSMTREQFQSLAEGFTHRRQSTRLAELANVAAFVASDRASAMTGTAANLTGGIVD